MSEVFDFGAIDAPKQVNYLRPGYYKMSIVEAKFEQPTGETKDGKPKTPFVAVTFLADEGQMTENFFVTPKAFARLQYLHEQWIGKKLEKKFESIAEIGAYFEKLLTDARVKKIFHTTCVGGKEGNAGAIFASLPYANFVINEEEKVSLGAFAEDSFEYRQNVKKNYTAATTTDDVMLGAPGNMAVPDDTMSDLPF